MKKINHLFLKTNIIISGIVLGVTLLGWAPRLLAGESRPSFEEWLKGVRKEALGQGISHSTVDSALANTHMIPEVISLDRAQPEFKMTLEEYLQKVVTEPRVASGREKLEDKEILLTTISSKYGVQPRFIVALWGIESNFGNSTGRFSVIEALATLAYDGRRSAFFRKELLNALRILDQGHIPRDRMKGSWAGAMGQLQFMPSTFQTFAVDYEGDGRIDIWGNLQDAFASAANYLSRSGWRKEETWGREIRLPKDFNRAFVGHSTLKPLTEWQGLGVRRPGGHDLITNPDLQASLIQPDGVNGRAFLVYDNFRTLLKWNRSDYFAVAVGILADKIGP